MSKKSENAGTELIVVTQLPVIEDKLLAVKASIETRVNEAMSLVCTEETYKQIKQVRADLNKEYAALEAKRKEIKKQILAPYERFEGVYKECAGDLYMSADRELAKKIAEVENGLKAEKATDLLNFFNEYRASVNIPEDFVRLENAGIKVGLSDSKTGLHKQAAAFLDRIASDLTVIGTLECRDEVLTEYSQDYNLSHAMLTVDNRHKAIEAERKRREEMEARKQEAAVSVAAVVQAVNETEIAAPVKVEAKIEEEPKVLKATFTVYGTLDQLKALKAFLTEGGYKYE